MTVRLLPPDRWVDFPDPAAADPDGLLAVGGDLSPERLLAAYRRGIFPWFGEGDPILWWSPDPRMVLYPAAFHISRRLGRQIRQHPFTLTADRAFEAVIRSCAAPGGGSRRETWIVPAMVTAYLRLHHLGHAHSIEVWQAGRLVGGLYGVAVGSCFCGESMFSARPNASKIALAFLAANLARRDCRMVDCQVPSVHLSRLGARKIRRSEFLEQLNAGLAAEPSPGRWEWHAERPAPLT